MEMEKNLKQIWDQLRAQKPQRKIFLEEIRIQGVRGIGDLRIPFTYPVSVLAGPNGCGKSTVLFALACSYSTGKKPTSYTPTQLFPNFKPSNATMPCDKSTQNLLIKYAYLHDGNRLSMQWSKSPKGKWNKSYLGQKGVKQPERKLYLKTLANLSNPSEVRGFLKMSRGTLQQEIVDASNISLAQRILQFKYSKLSIFKRGESEKNLLFAERGLDGENNQLDAQYSEFHMSAGERAVLRTSMELSKLYDALILIDEVEAGLHIYSTTIAPGIAAYFFTK
jgi:AAA15 family ATPase/GTPase